MLEKIRLIIKSGHKISVRVLKNSFQNQYRLQIGSIEMCNDLRKLGFTERKTKNLSLPNIPKKYIGDFIRGYSDGDGNVWTGIIHKDRKKQTLAIQVVFTSCSYSFLNSLQNIIFGYCKASGVTRKGNGNYYRLVYSIFGSLKLYNFMYNSIDNKDSRLYLKRKKKIFEKYLKMRS